MKPHELWALFSPDPSIPYEAWKFGAVPDKLAQLVLDGTKQATASLHQLYIETGENIPQVGQYSVILNSKDEAVCIIQATNVQILPFQDVTEEMAFIEGEGDKSLRYWKEVHWAFFQEEAASIGKTFTSDMLVIFETFQLVFQPPKDQK
jgi:uncharacterized protein YhfF